MACNKSVANKRVIVNHSSSEKRENKYLEGLGVLFMPVRLPKVRIEVFKKNLKKAGAIVKDKFDKSVTHVIFANDCTESQIRKYLDQFGVPFSSLHHEVEVVSCQWLSSCFSAGDCVSTEPFTFSLAGNQKCQGPNVEMKPGPSQDNFCPKNFLNFELRGTSHSDVFFSAQKAIRLFEGEGKRLKLILRRAKVTDKSGKEVIGISVLMCTDSFTEQIGWVPKELIDDIFALTKRSAINLESLIVKWISGKEETLSETFTKLRIKLNICGPNC